MVVIVVNYSRSHCLFDAKYPYTKLANSFIFKPGINQILVQKRETAPILQVECKDSLSGYFLNFAWDHASGGDVL